MARPEAHVKMEMSNSMSRLVPQPPLMSLSLGREMTSTVVTMLMDKNVNNNTVLDYNNYVVASS